MRKLRKLLSIAAICAFVLPQTAFGAVMPAEADAEDETVSAEETETDEAESESAENFEFEPFTAIENDECEVQIKGIDPDGYWGYTVDALLVNKSEDKNYTFSVSYASVNGVEMDPFWASTVSAGNKSNEEISFTPDDFEEAGIEEVTDIMLFFRVYDSEDYTADEIADEGIHIYPLGEDAAAEYVREPQETDTVILDNDDISVTVVRYYEDEWYGYTVEMFIQNKSERNLMISADNVAVNSYMMDPYWAATVHAGNVMYSKMYWYDSDFEKNEITEVEEIEFNLDVTDDDDWSAGSLYNEKVTLNP